MSDAQNRNGHDRWEGDAAAYALGALEPHEVHEFERHLTGCAECRRELAAMRSAVDALPMAAPRIAPDKELRQRVISAVEEERGSDVAVAGPPRSLTPGRRTWRISPRRQLMPAVAAAAIVAVVLAVVLAVHPFGGGNSTRTYAGIVNAPGATASVRVSGGRARLVFARLPKLPARLIYEIWLKRGAAAAPVPAGALFASSNGAVDVPGRVHGVQAVLVTAEPRPSGTRTPTRAPIIVVRLT